MFRKVGVPLFTFLLLFAVGAQGATLTVTSADDETIEFWNSGSRYSVSIEPGKFLRFTVEDPDGTVFAGGHARNAFGVKEIDIPRLEFPVIHGSVPILVAGVSGTIFVDGDTRPSKPVWSLRGIRFDPSTDPASLRELTLTQVDRDGVIFDHDGRRYELTVDNYLLAPDVHLKVTTADATTFDNSLFEGSASAYVSIPEGIETRIFAEGDKRLDLGFGVQSAALNLHVDRHDCYGVGGGANPCMSYRTLRIMGVTFDR
jgi:hypothetical protein